MLKLGERFKSYEHLKMEKNMLKIRTSYMGALLQKQGNLWENGVNRGVTPKFIKKSIALKRLVI